MPLPLEDYALIGDTHTAALVGRDGSIDWLCLPRFDSGACFAALLGDPSHGRWSIAPTEPFRTRRRYRPDTLVLDTEHETASGTVRITDFMTPRRAQARVVRIVEGVRGVVPVRSELLPRFDYGLAVPWLREVPQGVRAVAGPDAVHLRTEAPIDVTTGTVASDLMVRAGQRVSFVLTWHRSYEPVPARSTPSTRCATPPVLDAVVRTVRVPGGVARRGDAVADHAEGAHPPPDRRDRRRTHDVAARGARRRAELGLPVLLAPRRHLHALQLADGRL